MSEESLAIRELLAFNPGIVLSLAKAQAAGECTDMTRDDWELAIQTYADAAYDGRGMTKEARFAKSIGGLAYRANNVVHDEGNPVCELFYRAMKMAPPAPKKPEPEPVAKAQNPYATRMIELTLERRKTFPRETYEQSYVAVYTAPENSGLKDLANQWLPHSADAWAQTPAAAAVGSHRGTHDTTPLPAPRVVQVKNAAPTREHDMIVDPTPGAIGVSPGRA